jgi:hypothetical protein
LLLSTWKKAVGVLYISMTTYQHFTFLLIQCLWPTQQVTAATFFVILWMKFFCFDFNHQLFILSRIWYKLFVHSHNYRRHLSYVSVSLSLFLFFSFSFCFCINNFVAVAIKNLFSYGQRGWLVTTKLDYTKWFFLEDDYLMCNRWICGDFKQFTWMSKTKAWKVHKCE